MRESREIATVEPGHTALVQQNLQEVNCKEQGFVEDRAGQKKSNTVVPDCGQASGWDLFASRRAT